MSLGNRPPGGPRAGMPPRRRAWQAPGSAPDKRTEPAQASRKTPGAGAEPAPRKPTPPPGSAPPSHAAAPKPAQRGQPPTAARPGAGPSASARPARPGGAWRNRPAPSIPGPAAPSPAAPRGSPARGFRRGGFRRPAGPRGPALISRGERALFWSLLAAVLAMSIFLVRYRERVDAHFQSRAMAVPLAAAAAGPGSASGPLLLYLADDDTGALSERPLAFPLPDDPNTRARVVLEKLLSEYTAPGSPHPLKPLAPGVEGVDEVYLAPVAGKPHGTLAVVDLTPNFVHIHPSGIEPETLTLLSMIATLHANLPSVTEVRFLVDGGPRATLAGHADLSRTYLAGAAQMAPSEAFTSGAVHP